MEIYQCYQTKNRCYQRARSASHVGILVHSTGANNRNLKRYVDAPERLGINANGNHWNKDSTDKCMHGFVGLDCSGVVIVAHTLPFAYACWGCGKGSNGSYNYNPTAHIQFEICQGSNTDAEYYQNAIRVAAEFCAYLCQKFGFTAADICSHREAARRGYASNHGDPESWMRYFGDDMNQFRARVATLLAGGTLAVQEQGGETATMDTVRTGSVGAGVKQLQEQLIKLGYALDHGADGVFGAETLAALQKYQSDKGLETDGVCGPVTWASLTAAIAANGNVSAASDAAITEPADTAANMRYKVTIPSVDAATATQLLDSYPGATAEAIG